MHTVLTHLTLVLIRVWDNWSCVTSALANKCWWWQQQRESVRTDLKLLRQCTTMCEQLCVHLSENVWVWVLKHTITSQHTHTITKLLQPPSWLNMSEHEGLFFHSFYWLALFPLLLSFVFLSWGTWWSQILAQSAKSKTHKTRKTNKWACRDVLPEIEIKHCV